MNEIPPRLPELIAHADWGLSPKKRWMASARLTAAKLYCASAAEIVGNRRTLLNDLYSQVAYRGCVLLGFDFPIGLPAAYAQHVGVKSFRTALQDFGYEPWSDFYTPAMAPDQISLHRPFYPQRPGGARREHLMSALGLKWEDLLRACERRRPYRQAACTLFWTLGASQVGKAAIGGWQEILSPALRSGARHLVLWPLDGPFHRLVAPGRIVIAETYPTEYYAHLELRPQGLTPGQKWSKRRQRDRVESSQLLLHKARELGVALHPELSEAMEDGFGSDDHGEDLFDAVVGLFGMLNVVLGWRDPGDPPDERVRTIEGWILGQAPSI